MSPRSTEPPASSPRLSDAGSAYLDGLRAIAANLVLFSHVVLIHGGDTASDVSTAGASVAVSLFFLLSGFLITQSMLNWRTRPGPRLPGFLADRVARITTPYAPALLLIAAANALFITTKWGAPGVNTGIVPFIGNLLMLQDHSLLRLLELARGRTSWHVPLYNTAEPFWTVSVEIWIYVAAGLFFFCLLCRERLRQRWLLPMLALSLPVAVWNAAAGGGKSLSLIWLLGAVAACGLARLSGPHSPRSVWLALWLVVFGAAGLAGRVAKVGFDGFDLQTVALMAAVLFGVLVGLAQVHSVPQWLHRSCSFFASYSYSLYLIHNTALVVAYEALPDSPRWLSIGVGVLAAHGAAVLLYLGFERHHRRVAQWLRPRFERALLPRDAALLPAPESVPDSRAVPNAAHP